VVDLGDGFVLAANSTQLAHQIGAALGAVGAGFIAAGALGFLRGSQDEVGRRRERTATLIGALAVCAGFLVLWLFAFSR
jgi:hypothetical protein